jgi:hypothetical protein
MTEYQQDDECDESKCRSVGWDIFGWGYPRFGCYAQSREDQLLCANGYEGRIVDSEDKKEVVYHSDPNVTIAKSYYTCCPKGYDKNAVNRHCTDPMRMLPVPKDSNKNDENDGANLSMPCHDDKQKYPREMAMSAFYPDTYVCCDSFINETNTMIEKYDDGEFDGDDDGNAASGNFCDESKCISQYADLDSEYSCWGGGPGTLFPFRCNDGYIGRKIDTEYPIWIHLMASSSFNSFDLSYYTCCPPEFPTELPVKRQCSDSLPSLNTGNQTCDLNSNLKYPREMKTRYSSDANNSTTNKTNSYVCCDSQIDLRNETETGSDSYLDETECVPTCYANDLVQCLIDGNKFGRLVPMVCSNENSSFNFSRKVHTRTLAYGDGKTRDYTLYECCKTRTDGPFIIDYGFKITVWPQLLVSSIAVLFSAVLISGLSMGMIKESRRGTGCNLSQIQVRSRRQRQRQPQQQGYNGYNYYLILLTVPDLVLNVFLLGLYASYANQFYIPEFSGYVVVAYREDSVTVPFDYAIVLGCSTANLWMNALIANAVFELLKDTHKGIRVKPPTIKKATVRGIIVYIYALIIFFAHYFLDGNINMTIAAPIYFMLSAGFPIIYLCYVCIIIWYRGLVPSLGGRLREISLYFFRIIVVYLVVWLPSIALMLTTGPVRTRDLFDFTKLTDESSTEKHDERKNCLYPAGLLLCAIQTIVSAGMALTKTDVRKYVIDLLTLSYCRHREEDQEHREEDQENSSRNGEQQRNDQNRNDH